MVMAPKPSPKPGTQTTQPRGEKGMPKPSAKTLSEENKETRKGGK
jgi:hypothetical protein